MSRFILILDDRIGLQQAPLRVSDRLLIIERPRQLEYVRQPASRTSVPEENVCRPLADRPGVVERFVQQIDRNHLELACPALTLFSN